MKFNLCRIRPQGFLHSSAFSEVMDSLSWALSYLGHEVTQHDNWTTSENNIFFGCELLVSDDEVLPPNSVLFNLEQPSHPNIEKVKDLVVRSKATVWDYSYTNYQMWLKLGVNARHVPIGYTPNLTRIPIVKNKDIDVAFFGWLTPRRMEVIQKLRSVGLNVFASDSCYGGARDNIIARSKILLNVHHDGRNLFESVRCSYYLANAKFVVSEVSADDYEYSDVDSLARVPYKDIVGNICWILQQKSDWDFVHHRALEQIRTRDYVQTVKLALEGPADERDECSDERVAARYHFATKYGDMREYGPWLRKHARGNILEIGVRDGASTSCLLRGVEENGGHLYSIDIADCGHLFKGHPNWTFVQMSSREYGVRYGGIPVDMIFVDGDHTREGYRHDLQMAEKAIKPGGLIVSHDITPNPEYVLEKVPNTDAPSLAIGEEYRAFCDRTGWKHEELPGHSGLGIITKPEVVESDESWEASRQLQSISVEQNA